MIERRQRGRIVQKSLSFLTVFLWLIVSSISGRALAAPSSLPDDLLSYLDLHFPKSYQVISHVSEKHGSRVVFNTTIKLTRGNELIVLKQEKNVPTYLLHQASVIRVEAILEKGKILAQEMAILSREAQRGDPVAIPASPVIYLYTNIQHKEIFKPYMELIQKLLAKGFEVVEVTGTILEPRTDRYGILLRLEGAPGYLAFRIQSIYSGDTLYFANKEYTGKIATIAPVGTKITLPYWKATTGLYAQAPKQQPAFTTPPPAAPGPEKQRSFQKAQPVTITNQYRLNKAFKRMVVCNLDNDGRPDFVFLRDDGIDVYNFEGQRFTETLSFAFTGGPFTALHLHAMDINGDGDDELFVTLGMHLILDDFEDTELSSMILEYVNHNFHVITDDMPYYLRVIEDRSGNKVALAQSKGQKELYKGEILQLVWDSNANSIREAGEYSPAHDVYSIYQFNLIPEDPDRIMILEPSNELQVYYTPTEAPEVISDKNYGFYAEIPFIAAPKQERYIGGFTKQQYRTVYAPRRFVLKNGYDGQMFLIDKGTSQISVTSPIGTLLQTSKGEDSLVGVKWISGQIRETWRSESIAKRIIDFGFVKLPQGDKIVLLLKDKRGYSIEIIQ